MRAVIAGLRDEYAALRQRAAAASAVHAARGLSSDELRLDPELEALLRAEGEERLLEVGVARRAEDSLALSLSLSLSLSLARAFPSHPASLPP